MGGPGSAKVRQGSIFDGKTGLILRFPFFALNDFWKAPRGSRERAGEQQEFQRGAQGGAPSSLWGPEGGPKTKRDPLVTTGGARAEAEGPGENNYQRLTETNRQQDQEGSITPWADGPANFFEMSIWDFVFTRLAEWAQNAYTSVNWDPPPLKNTLRKKVGVWGRRRCFLGPF